MSWLPRSAHILSRAAALAAGVLFGFFVAFNAVFTDVFGLRDMLGAIAYVIGSYLVLGAVFGAAGPTAKWRWAPWLAAPGVLLAATTIPDAPERMLYVAGVMSGATVATLAGLWLGGAARNAVGRAKPGQDTPLSPSKQEKEVRQ